MMLTIPPHTFTSSSSPLLNPARRRTLGGITKVALFLTVIVMACLQRNSSHRQQRGHQLDPVPQILDADVLVEAVLIVVVIRDRNSDRPRADRALDHLQ